MRLLLLLLAACVPVTPDGPLLGALSVEAPGVVRVATWNLETVGEAGSDEYEHALAVLDRLRPDVLAVNEIGSRADRDHFDHFAVDAGYPYVAVAEVGFGSDRNGVLSRFPIEVESLNAASISGDPEANDLTRDFLQVGVELPSGQNLTVVSMHWKSGSSGGFRRAVESHRAAQVADTAGPIILMGDLNVDLDDGPVGPEHYDFLPSGLPAAYQLGSDLATNLEQDVRLRRRRARGRPSEVWWGAHRGGLRRGGGPSPGLARPGPSHRG